ncbi:uncharacterized protein [Littorina saxatilis]|uniref:Uncharacterized protein n=1 Tax=Littorina saxatilis TaxID=31220 RepID=A0AAN9AM27_9CAEN
MEKRLAFLLNSCKAGNIFDAEGEELKSLIDDYFLSDGNQCSERPEGDSESSDCDSESDDDERRRTENQLPDNFFLAESEFDDVGEEIEEPIVRISGPGDEQMDDCNGVPPPELLQMLRQFSCNCKQIKDTLKLCRPMTDLCWRCQSNNTKIFRGANLTDEEKGELML